MLPVEGKDDLQFDVVKAALITASIESDVCTLAQ
jgi:hypothetical protein